MDRAGNGVSGIEMFPVRLAVLLPRDIAMLRLLTPVSTAAQSRGISACKFIHMPV